MNHLGDANKMVGEDVSNEQMTAHATPNEELRRQILSHVVPKNEREWWAARAIERLEFELNAANDRIKRLEEENNELRSEEARLLNTKGELERRIKRLEQAGNEMFKWSERVGQEFWLKAKEDKL